MQSSLLIACHSMLAKSQQGSYDKKPIPYLRRQKGITNLSKFCLSNLSVLPFSLEEAGMCFCVLGGGVVSGKERLSQLK